MQSTSELYDTIWGGNHRVEAKIEAYSSDGTSFLGVITEDKIIDLKTSRSILNDTTFGIGNCTCGEMDATIRPIDEKGNQLVLPKMAQLKIFVRLVSLDTDDVSEWLPKGVFFIDTRQSICNSFSHQPHQLKLHGLDAMLKAEAGYPSDDESEYPATGRVIVTKIAAAMGINIDSRLMGKISNTQTYGLPIGFSMREVLEDIGTKNYINFIISDAGELSADYSLNPSVTSKATIDANATNIERPAPDSDNIELPAPHIEFSKVSLIVNDSVEYIAGDDSKETLECHLNMEGSQDIANDILEKVSNFIYYPFVAKGVVLNPAIEIGDRITIGQDPSDVFSQDITFGHTMFSDVSAPYTVETESEYKYVSPKERKYKRQFSSMGSSIAQTAQYIGTRVYTKDEVGREISSAITQSARDIELSITDDIKTYLRYYVDDSYTPPKPIIELGVEGQDIELIQTTDKVAFVDKTTDPPTELAYISSGIFYMPNAEIIDKINFGGYEADTHNGVVWKWKGRGS